MAKQNTKTSPVGQKAEPKTPTETPPVQLERFRIPVADIEDEAHPEVRILELEAPSYEQACEIVNQLPNPCQPSLPGVAALPCRFEEALPFFRQGFGLRRETWPVTEVLLKHPHVGTRLDIYRRNPEHPRHNVAYLRSAELSGDDLMSEDWVVVARPPNFGK